MSAFSELWLRSLRVKINFYSRMKQEVQELEGFIKDKRFWALPVPLYMLKKLKTFLLSGKNAYLRGRKI